MSSFDDAAQREGTGPRGRPSVGRLALSFVLGAAGAVPGFVFGLPGHGEFVPGIWLPAFVAALMAPGWSGFLALIAGVTCLAAILDMSDGVFGLVFLIVAILGALAAQAALSAWALLRLRSLGWKAALGDQRFLAGAGVAIGLLLVFAWFAGEFARNPP
jgi:hypothetical protein